MAIKLKPHYPEVRAFTGWNVEITLGQQPTGEPYVMVVQVEGPLGDVERKLDCAIRRMEWMNLGLPLGCEAEINYIRAQKMILVLEQREDE